MDICNTSKVWFFSFILLIGLLLSQTLRADSIVISEKELIVNSDDTLRDRGLLMLNQHMDNLRNLSERQFAFKSGYLNPNPTVPCEYCAQQKDIKLDDYVVDISNRYKNYDFTYQIVDSYNDMEVITNQKGDYEVAINVKMTVRGLLESDNTLSPKKQNTQYLTYKFRLDYNRGVFGIAEILAKRAPGANIWMVELSPNLRLSSLNFDSQEVFGLSSSSAILTKLGVVRYFNPFAGTNEANVWLKVGARANLLTSELASDFLDIPGTRVRLDGATESNPHSIDVIQSLTGIVEKKTSVLIEVPIGFSRRFKLSPSRELSLEAEVSYSFPVFTKYRLTYKSDKLGTNHLLNNDIQSASGGDPIVYDANPEAVLAANGELIEFVKGQPINTSPKSDSNPGYFTFSLRPTLMLRKFETVKYNIGVNVGFSTVTTDLFQMDSFYFNNSGGEDARPIHDADESSLNIFAGIVFGITF